MKLGAHNFPGKVLQFAELVHEAILLVSPSPWRLLLTNDETGVSENNVLSGFS